ncbi:Siroheme synthase [Furfurilactobacillus rossiae]|uniref:precorrin-2 dehydrogenase/sirohydrochlorin ferrochelatase family protein n=1 Tax=Furfurilactobacillus rossiae TaxID=231049 RepID=UPI001CDB9432|nr:bifunctional precorrin-2 dehydrogenase/sirohydrochlorin ferrochelatase [Furfurilactobacillus rossiae]MCF6165843.1 bifunctional precorrin-2 dehydrogenase/sirohydrochlorin ferrochelatase [Furfurilactobacillus rossiae]QLE64407.1 Siroheme synthase [Furfurilactobacillus rossiae]
MGAGYPILLNLTDRHVLVVGGGKIAARKINGLLTAGAIVTVIAPKLVDQIDTTKITWYQRNYEAADLRGETIIFAATDDENLNHQIWQSAGQTQWVNDVSNHRTSDFFNVAQVRTKKVLIGISTFGQSPSKAKRLKKQLQDWIGKEAE